LLATKISEALSQHTEQHLTSKHAARSALADRKFQQNIFQISHFEVILKKKDIPQKKESVQILKSLTASLSSQDP
jgi:hypothetical protein